MKKLLPLLFTGLCFSSFAQTKASFHTADSLFTIKQWKAAKSIYLANLGDTSTNSLEWNRLGYCNQNLGLYVEALKDYQRSLDNKPIPPVMGIVSERMARIYSLTNKFDQATDMLVKSATVGYNVLPDMDTLADFKNMRQVSNYNDMRKKVYETVFPCAAEPHSHDFDFWIGEWDVYQTGGKFLVGHSSVQGISGGCAILENWTSTQASNGKSINYYNATTGKWEQDWIGSGGGPQRYLGGEYKDKVMTFTYETTNAQGKKVTGSFKFYNIDQNTVRQYQDVNNDDGKTVTVSYDFTYVRKKQ